MKHLSSSKASDWGSSDGLDRPTLPSATSARWNVFQNRSYLFFLHKLNAFYDSFARTVFVHKREMTLLLEYRRGMVSRETISYIFYVIFYVIFRINDSLRSGEVTKCLDLLLIVILPGACVEIKF